MATERTTPCHKSRHGITRDEFRQTAKAYAKRGTDLPHARLNPELVRRIRRNLNGWPARRWAEELGVHVRTIEKVQRRLSWEHVE